MEDVKRLKWIQKKTHRIDALSPIKTRNYEFEFDSIRMGKNTYLCCASKKSLNLIKSMFAVVADRSPMNAHTLTLNSMPLPSAYEFVNIPLDWKTDHKILPFIWSSPIHILCIRCRRHRRRRLVACEFTLKWIEALNCFQNELNWINKICELDEQKQHKLEFVSSELGWQMMLG